MDVIIDPDFKRGSRAPAIPKLMIRSTPWLISFSVPAETFFESMLEQKTIALLDSRIFASALMPVTNPTFFIL